MIKQPLKEKRHELIWALNLQGYTDAQIAQIFMECNRVTIMRINKKRPKDYKVKWVKI